MIIITVARKPPDGTVASNVLKHGTGGINIDGCRLQTGDNLNGGAYAENATERHDGAENWRYKRGQLGNAATYQTPTGRWPANLILQHQPECLQIGVVTVPGYTINRWDDGAKPFGGGAGHPYTGEKQPDEQVDAWQCVEGCAVADIDEQSGVTSSAVRSGGEGGYLDTSRESWRFKRASGGFY